MKKDLRWYGQIIQAEGYSKVGHEMLRRLVKNYNIEVEEYTDRYRDYFVEDEFKDIAELTNNKVNTLAPLIVCLGPGPRLDYKGYKIIYTMMETKDLHPEFVRTCDLYDEVWFPSSFNYNQYINQGGKKTAYIMPLGVDTICYKPGLKPLNIVNKKKFNFLSVFFWTYRKGPDILVRAFCEEFDKDEDVALIIATKYFSLGTEQMKQDLINQINFIKSCIDKPIDKIPSISFVSVPLKEKYMPNLYNSVDCYISTTRGEGFLLPLIEAMACGIPTIVTNFSAHLDFANSNNSYLIDIEGFENKPELKDWISPWYVGQQFAIPSVKHTRELMRYVYEHYDEAKKKAQIALQDVTTKWTWDIAAEKVSKRIEEIYQIYCPTIIVPKKLKKISVCLIVYNEEQILKYTLPKMVEFADTMIIIEGSPEGVSTDKTAEIILNNMNEKVIYKRGKFGDHTLENNWDKVQRNEYLKYINTEWMMLWDADEAYLDEDLEEIRRIINDYDNIVQVNYDYLHFWENCEQYITDDNKHWGIPCHHVNIFRPGFHYKDITTCLCDENGKYLVHYDASQRFYSPKIKLYHYSRVMSKEKQFMKDERYRKRGEIVVSQEENIRIEKFTGKHPDYMRDFILKNE